MTTTKTCDALTLKPSSLDLSLDPVSQGVELGAAVFERKYKNKNESVSVFYGKHEGKDVVVKIFHRKGEQLQSPRAKNEIAALKRLTSMRCSHAPSFIKTFTLPAAADADDHYVVMSKLPGYDLSDCEKWSDNRTMMHQYFQAAQRAVLDCGVNNESHMLRNIMFDPDQKKCFIVDFERATLQESWKTSSEGMDLDDWN